MPQQFVHIVQIHIIVVHLVVLLGIAAYIPVTVHLRTPLLLRTRHVHLRVLRRMRYNRFHIGHLTLGVSIEVRTGTVVPSKHITQISRTPTGQRHPPANTTMQPCLSVPVAVGCHRKRPAKSVDIRIRSIELYSACQHLIMFDSLFPQHGGTLKCNVTDFIEFHKHVCHSPTCSVSGSGYYRPGVGSRLQHTIRVGPHIPIALHALTVYVAHNGLDIKRIGRVAALKTEQSALFILQSHHRHTQFDITPTLVAQQIDTRSIDIPCLAIVGRI